MSRTLTSAQQGRRVAVATFIGSTVEWYDFFIYGTTSALILNRLFFPEFDPLVGTLLAFTTFAIGWLARPIGGIIAGHFGDKIGRKSMLVLTMLTMGVATFVIGLLPTYDSIGVWAAVILLGLRLIQGLAVGGEYGGAVVMALESAPEGKRGLWASLPQSGVPFGLFLGTLVFIPIAALPEEQLLSWGWRLPFLLSAILVVVGLFIRLRVVESAVFKKAQQEDNVTRTPALEVLRHYPGRVLLLMVAHIAPNTFFYTFATFIIAFAVGTGQYTGTQVLSAVAIAAAVEVVTIPMFAALSDRVGRKRVYISGLVALAVITVPFFALVLTGTYWLLILALVVALSFAHAAVYGPQASFFAEYFPTRVRYTGLSMGYQIAGAIFGGPLPIIGTALVAAAAGSPWIFVIYLVGAAIASIIGASFMTENRDDDLNAIAKPNRRATNPPLAEPV